MDFKKIGDRIRYFRNKRSLTQQSLAEKIGLARESVARIESGKEKTSLETLIKIANTLKISADDLLAEQLFFSPAYQNSELHKLLLDCTKTEESILIQTMIALKKILYSMGI